MKSIALIACFLLSSCSLAEKRNYEIQERSYWSGPAPHGIDNTEPYGSITLCVSIDYENRASLSTLNPHGRYPNFVIFETKKIASGHYVAKFADELENRYTFELIDDGVKIPVLIIENDALDRLNTDQLKDIESRYIEDTYNLNRGECPY